MDHGGKFYDDDGTEVNPDLFPKPQLCLSCKKNEDSNEEILCTLTRLDQRNEIEFKCFAYEKA
ncbi:hypothetical protein [Peijinzhouia sedimentorum]